MNGRKLVTLKDAGEYITKLPKEEHDAPEWQAAMEALMLVVENGGRTMFARIGIMRALNRGKPPPDAGLRRKKAEVYRVMVISRASCPLTSGFPPHRATARKSAFSSRSRRCSNGVSKIGFSHEKV
ncbi:hypothetical protein [Bradyrhizobium sp. CB1650]|uniref:hypothetical protein n=1 Tax=Bradyrhizobium sp. CB1650 TaxID=3039153 RepID=UPI00325FDC94